MVYAFKSPPNDFPQPQAYADDDNTIYSADITIFHRLQFNPVKTPEFKPEKILVSEANRILKLPNDLVTLEKTIAMMNNYRKNKFAETTPQQISPIQPRNQATALTESLPKITFVAVSKKKQNQKAQEAQSSETVTTTKVTDRLGDKPGHPPASEMIKRDQTPDSNHSSSSDYSSRKGNHSRKAPKATLQRNQQKPHTTKPEYVVSDKYGTPDDRVNNYNTHRDDFNQQPDNRRFYHPYEHVHWRKRRLAQLPGKERLVKIFRHLN
ncbi:hypothetical protein M569_09648 [Genlisea aurea]|uniref:Uncharacterized protein n=1 Tax=Genlisea aurea TaxID=192259 RepID=S8CKB0_9LAMI|nr:hypothetical protein M569_09648 [Genlisea aurea]